MTRRKPNNEGQLSFDDIGRPYHDYSQELGGEYPMVVANDEPGLAEEVKGVSVSLKDRYTTLERAGRVYARYASRTIGLGKAALDPGIRSDLEKRYGNNVETVVAGAKRNSSLSFANNEINIDHPSDEQRMLEDVLRTRELVAVGFEPVDVEIAAQETIIEVRHAIGVSVGQAARNRNIKKAKDTANNS